MSAQEVVESVTRDSHASRRLRNNVEVEIRRGAHGILTTVENDQFSVVACIEDGVDAARFHESMAATCIEALHELDQLNWRDE